MRTKFLRMTLFGLLVLPMSGVCQECQEEETYEPSKSVYYFSKELLPWEEQMIREMAPKALKQILAEDRDEEGIYQWLEGATIGRAVPVAEVWGVRKLNPLNFFEPLKGTKWENVYLSFNGYLVELVKEGKRTGAMELFGFAGTMIDETVEIWEDEAKMIALPYARERGASIGEVWLDMLSLRVGYFGAGASEEKIKENVVDEEPGWRWVVGLVKDGFLVGVVRVDAGSGEPLVIDFPVPCRLGSRLTAEQLVRAATIYARVWGEKYWRERPDFALEGGRYDPPEVQNFFPVEPQPEQLFLPWGTVHFKSNISVWELGSPFGSGLTVRVSMFGELREISVEDPHISHLIIPGIPGESGEGDESKVKTCEKREKGRFRRASYLLPLILLPAVFGVVFWRVRALLLANHREGGKEKGKEVN